MPEKCEMRVLRTDWLELNPNRQERVLRGNVVFYSSFFPKQEIRIYVFSPSCGSLAGIAQIKMNKRWGITGGSSKKLHTLFYIPSQVGQNITTLFRKPLSSWSIPTWTSARQSERKNREIMLTSRYHEADYIRVSPDEGHPRCIYRKISHPQRSSFPFSLSLSLPLPMLRVRRIMLQDNEVIFIPMWLWLQSPSERSVSEDARV